VALNALRTGVYVVDDGGGRGLKESVKRRIPEGIKRTAQTYLPDGFRSRHVLRICKVGIGLVFGSADSDEHGIW